MADTYATGAAIAPAQARLEGGRVTGTLDASLLHAGEVGVVVDGVLLHTVVAQPAAGGTASFSFPLTGPFIPADIDLEALATGRRLLAAPLTIADGFVLDELRCAGVLLEGGFSLAWAPHPFLPLAFLSDDGVVARGVAGHVPGGEAASYRFRLPLAVLPAGTLHVVPVVAGQRRAAHARSLDCPLAGYVDVVAGAEVSGWLVDVTAPGEAARVDVRRGGRVVASTVTGRPRPDVAMAIPGAGSCGFAVDVPVSERMRGDAEPYQVVVGGTQTGLRDGVVRVAVAAGRLNQLDTAVAGVVSGWALDGAVDGPVPVEVRHGGRVIAAGVANLFRPDLAEQGLGAAGLPVGCCAFAIRLGPAQAGLTGQPVEVWAAGHRVDGSPRVLEPNPNLLRFLQRRDRVRPAVLPRLGRALDRRAGLRSVSLVLCAHGAEPGRLSTALAAVVDQWCSRWELLCVHDGFAEPATARVLAQSARREPRIRLVPAAASAGPAGFLGAGIAAARSGYIAVLPPGHRLEPDAVYRLLRAVRETEADVLYTDACTVDPGSGGVLGIVARTAFSAERFRSAPFWPDLLCLRSSLAQSVHAAHPGADGLAFATHAFGSAGSIAHVPAVTVARPPGLDAAGDGVPGDRTAFAGTLLMVVAGPGAPDGLADAAGVPCRTAVLGEDAGPAACNAVVARDGEGCAAILFVAAGAAAPGPGALARLLALVARPEIAAAGPVLAGADGRIAAAGLVVGGPGGVVPGLAGADAGEAGPLRDVSALPGAFLLVRADAFAAVGGFDPGYAAAGLLCDADLCLRMAAAGRGILLEGGVAVDVAALARTADPADLRRFHDRHGPRLRQGDPWYSPFLDDDGSGLLRSGPGCRPAYPARVVHARPAAAG